MTSSESRADGGRRRVIFAAQAIPIVLAVIVTSCYGFWAKSQPGFEDDWRRGGPRGLRFPVVTAALAETGTGSPPKHRWANAPDAGAWAWIELQDDGIPRRIVSRRLLAVAAKVTDGHGRSWPTVVQDYRGGVLVFVPRGYPEAADGLTLTVSAGSRRLGAWPLPELAAPEKRVLPLGANRATIRVTSTNHVGFDSNLVIELERQVPPRESLQVAVVGHTYLNVEEPEWFEISEGAKRIRVPSRIIGDPAAVAQVELLVQRYRTTEVTRRIDLSKSYVKTIDTMPLLVPRPPTAEISYGFGVRITAIPRPVRDLSRPIPIDLVLASASNFRDFQAKIVEPKSGHNGIELRLVNRVATRRGLLFTKPEEPVTGPAGRFRAGAYPIVLDVRAWPSELMSTERVVLPLQHEGASQTLLSPNPLSRPRLAAKSREGAPEERP